MTSNLMKLAGYSAVVSDFKDLLDKWSDDGDVWVVGTPAEYAIFVHEGTSRMEGRPFLRDAIDIVINQKGDQFAKEAESAAEFKKLVAMELEGETIDKITEYDAVDSNYMRGSTEAVKL